MNLEHLHFMILNLSNQEYAMLFGLLKYSMEVVSNIYNVSS